MLIELYSYLDLHPESEVLVIPGYPDPHDDDPEKGLVWVQHGGTSIRFHLCEIPKTIEYLDENGFERVIDGLAWFVYQAGPSTRSRLLR